MFNLDDIANENKEDPYIMLIVGGFGSEKANAQLNLI